MSTEKLEAEVRVLGTVKEYLKDIKKAKQSGAAGAPRQKLDADFRGKKRRPNSYVQIETKVVNTSLDVSTIEENLRDPIDSQSESSVKFSDSNSQNMDSPPSKRSKCELEIDSQASSQDEDFQSDGGEKSNVFSECSPTNWSDATLRINATTISEGKSKDIVCGELVSVRLWELTPLVDQENECLEIDFTAEVCMKK